MFYKNLNFNILIKGLILPLVKKADAFPLLTEHFF